MKFLVFHEGKTNTALPDGCPLGHRVCWLALLLLRLGKNPTERRGEGQPGREEVRTIPGKFPRRHRNKGRCCSCLQAWHAKLLRTDEKGHWACEGLLQLGQSGEHIRGLQCANTKSVWEERLESPRVPHGWRSYLSLIASVRIWFSTNPGYITRDKQQKGDSHSRMVRKCHFPLPYLCRTQPKEKSKRKKGLEGGMRKTDCTSHLYQLQHLLVEPKS